MKGRERIQVEIERGKSVLNLECMSHSLSPSITPFYSNVFNKKHECVENPKWLALLTYTQL
jgi:hypothetical protein